MVYLRKFVLLVVVAVSSVVGVIAASDLNAPSSDRPPDYAAMIEALASRNAKPEKIDGKPFFPPDFAWDDQRRVGEAFHKLRHDGSEELWEELLTHLDDDRYSLTMEFNDSGIGVNYSVGSLCRMLAYKHLTEDVPDHYGRVDRPVKVLKDLRRNLAEWRQARADKSLCELQIEVCELGLQEFDNLKDLNFVEEDRRKEIRRNIESQLDELKRTKKPAFRPLVLDSYAFYGKDKAHPRKSSKPKPQK